MISIHPMLLFILYSFQIEYDTIFISIHPMLLFINVRCRTPKEGCINFNTSHVTVYPLLCMPCVYSLLFQYIPCYCLSEYTYCGYCSFGISIHPMLLFIVKRVQTDIQMINFNTSHVTVYLYIPSSSNMPSLISIHPMLLFIIIHNLYPLRNIYFNTSHVTVYPIVAVWLVSNP